MTSRAPERVVWAVEQLAPTAADHVLEIGCGPGHAVALLCSRVVRGSVTAIDRSALQVKKAKALNRACVAAGRARIQTMALADVAVGLGKRFTKVLAVNVNAFWVEPAPNIAHLGTLLRAGGSVALVYEAPSAAGLRKLRAVLPDELAAHGFAVEEVREPSARKSPMLCVVARRAGR